MPPNVIAPGNEPETANRPTPASAANRPYHSSPSTPSCHVRTKREGHFSGQTKITPKWWGADERTRQCADVTSRLHVAGQLTPASDAVRGWRPIRKGYLRDDPVLGEAIVGSVPRGSVADFSAALPGRPTSRPKRGPKTIKQWATLTREHDVTAPELPERHIPWDARTVQSRQDLWASPMATQYDYTDRHRLFMLADLVDSYWRVDGVRDKIALAAGIRIQGQRFGLSALDRQRLRWELELEHSASNGRSRTGFYSRCSPASTSASSFRVIWGRP